MIIEGDIDRAAQLARLTAENMRWRARCDDAARGLVAAGREVDELRADLATAHEQVGQAIALLNQGHTEAAASVLHTWLRRG